MLLVVGFTPVDLWYVSSGCQVLWASPPPLVQRLPRPGARRSVAEPKAGARRLASASKRDVRVGELLRRTPAVRLHIAYQDLLADGSLRIRAHIDVEGSENVWRTCNTIDRGRQSRPREENAHVHGLSEARRAPGRG